MLGVYRYCLDHGEPFRYFSIDGLGAQPRLRQKEDDGYPTTRPEPGLAGESLFDALPQKLIRRILSVNHSSFPVLAGDKEKAIIALKFEPSNIVDAAPIWWTCVFQVVSDGLRFQIQRVGAVIREVIVEGSRLLFASTGRGPVNEGLANALNIDLDSHPAGPIVGDDARRVVKRKMKGGICALH